MFKMKMKINKLIPLLNIYKIKDYHLTKIKY
jgi:hypothetical protein